LAEAAKFQEFHGLTDEQRQDFFMSAPLIIKGHIGSGAYAKVLAYAIFWLCKGESSGSRWILRSEQRWCQRP